MPRHDVVVLGGSAGSLEPLTTIVNALPVGLKASVLVVMHMRAGPDGVLPDILDRATQLPVAFAKFGQAPHPGMPARFFQLQNPSFPGPMRNTKSALQG